MKLLEPGTNVDSFVVRECIHAGGMAHIYRVDCSDSTHCTAFPLAMKIPRMTAGDGAENIVGFEVEQTILPLLSGPYVPRFVAAGDLLRLPYLVMEYVPGQTLQQWIDAHAGKADGAEIARIGAAMAVALHHLHQQNVCHLDVKPANLLLRESGDALNKSSGQALPVDRDGLQGANRSHSRGEDLQRGRPPEAASSAARAVVQSIPGAVLLDFGLSCHAHYPDLLAEEMRKAVGSPTWIAPEQVVGVRGDLRSDIFAAGVILYEMATAELPFGSPATQGGLRQRLWMTPAPPRQHRPDIPEWLQEIILRCLEPEAAERYPSAAHLAFDLAHPQQVQVTERGQRLRGPGWRVHFKRWIRAAGMHYQPSPLPARQIAQVPIVMVAVPHDDVTDATLYSLREAVARSLGIRPGARLACVTVISPNASSTSDSQRSETALHRQHLARLKQWAAGLDLTGHTTSFHVLESTDVAQTLVRYAEANHVDMMILGAATHGLQLQRFVHTVPLQVARDAPCTVILVKQQVPFWALAAAT